MLFSTKRMLFRAVITEQQDYRGFLSVITALSKNNSKECVLNITEKGLMFIIQEENRRTTLPLIWSEISKGAFFSNYSFKGCSEEHWEIYLVFNPIQFAKALASIKQVFQYIKISLTSKKFACLSVEVKMTSTISTETKRIVHDIPVTVILPKRWDSYRLPKLPILYTTVQMPNLRQIVDKYAKISPTMTFHVNLSSNELSLTIETETTTVLSNFSNIEMDHCASGTEISELSCQVETKSLACFFNSLQFCNILLKNFFIDQQGIKFRFLLKEDVYFNAIATAATLE